jgi:hypothetical protein
MCDFIYFMVYRREIKHMCKSIVYLAVEYLEKNIQLNIMTIKVMYRRSHYNVQISTRASDLYVSKNKARYH